MQSKGRASVLVKSALDKQGMSIKELSRRTSTNYYTARNCILGKTSMSAEYFLKFSQVLNIDFQRSVYLESIVENDTEIGE